MKEGRDTLFEPYLIGTLGDEVDGYGWGKKDEHSASVLATKYSQLEMEM